MVHWHQEQPFGVKWDGMTSDIFPVCNGIKRSGILYKKIFNIYVDVLNIKLNKTMAVYCVNVKIIDHFYNANGLMLLSPCAREMQSYLMSAKIVHLNIG